MTALHAPASPVSQTAIYDSFYGSWRRLRWLFRFDVLYRRNRLREVMRLLEIDARGARVLDVGFGTGGLLRAFPHSCRLTGAEVSASAVEAARRDPAYSRWAAAEFIRVPERDPEALPPGPFDAVVSSHTLEHVEDDRAELAAFRRRLPAGGWLFVFVPIEEPHYNPDHVRAYSVADIGARVREAGFDLVWCEASMQVAGHLWKLVTIPSRRRWPVLKPAADALRLGTLSLLPHPAHLALDAGLGALGVGPRQAFVVARARG